MSFTVWFSDRSEYFQSTTSSFSNGGGSREKTELDDSPEFHSVNYPHYAEMFKVKKYYIPYRNLCEIIFEGFYEIKLSIIGTQFGTFLPERSCYNLNLTTLYSL